MPEFTITLSNAALAKLMTVVADTNAQQGTTLTVRDWIILHLLEMAIGRDMAAAADTLRRQAEADATAALDAALRDKRKDLLEALEE